MSLTRELNKKQSPFRQLVEGCAPALAVAGGRSPEGKRIAERLGLYELVRARVLMMLGKFEPRRSASAAGMDAFDYGLAPLLPNGQHISDVLGDAFLEAERLTRDGDDIDRDYASIIFAWCESLYRAGVQVIRSSWATLSSISTTTTKPSASASGCHDRRRSRRGPSRKFLVVRPARYWRRHEWMCRV